MRLTSEDGTVVDLRVTGYQFPDLMGPHDAAESAFGDANWLLVSGRVRKANGRGWAFADPCLLVDEAQALAGWLRTAAAGRFPGYRRRDGSPLTFLEPSLRFALRARDGDRVVVRVGFAHECGPDPRRGGRPATVLLRMSSSRLAQAAGEWSEEIARFPRR